MSSASASAQADRAEPSPAAQPPSGYRLFDLRVKRRLPITPSLLRLVFTGADVAQMNTLAPDQRVKLLFPAADGSLPAFDNRLHWNDARRQLPLDQRPPMRTYTIRALRRDAAEVDVDFVLHGINGPASAWATHATEGDRVQMVAPNLAFAGDPGGYEWKPPQGLQRLLLVGDETALPAIAGILQQLAEQASQARVQAFIEVPLLADCLELARPAHTELHWLAREQLRSEHGQAMLEAVREQAWLPTAAASAAGELDELNIDEDILWEQASGEGGEFHAWIAGESSTVMTLRRWLIQERGLDRRTLSLMGYWRAGRSLD
ncbi:siderophore-interacting protein [Pseudomonas cremoricolorata]|uniref:Iron utilization protein n=1 Tax=Pseudomonas cremoricolorata TaxID=157783 RepID=A0A089WNN7_9PSED|nr:siderophore-interacting protein [Pseudomonas cremoricolorata]AIR90166.1 iron utilization protein [Pseudomonas cremoricolorata]